MKWKQYSTYKDSGVEWLGEVPDHWNIKRLGYFFSERRQKVSDKEYAPLSVTKNGIVPQLDTAAKTDDGDNRKRVCAGDFVINSRSDRKGSSGLSGLDGSVSLINTVLQPNDLIHPKFAHHLLRSYPFQEEYYRYGKGIVADLWSTNYSEMRNISVALPCLEEQSVIADFVDSGTAKIDTLISKQEQLIELAKEKRQAIISQAITKGLTPNVPMKESGLDGLGQVPEHWKVCPIKRIGTIRYGIGEPPKYRDTGTPLIRATNVDAGNIIEEGLVYVSPADIPANRIVWLQKDDIIVVRSGAYTGDSAIIPDAFSGAIAGFDMVLRCNRASAKFVQYALLSKYLKEGQIDLEKMRAAQPHLNSEELGSCTIVLPPPEEQGKIVALLDKETAKIDLLIAKSRRNIELMREHRTALISAAVTGKIDVREAA